MLCVLACAPVAPAQKNKGGGQQSAGQQSSNQSGGQGGNQSGGQGGGQGGGQSGGSGSTQFPGLTWPKDAWDSLITLDDSAVRKDSPLYTLCYELLVTTGPLSSPPFVLKPVDHLSDYVEPLAPSCLKPPDDQHPILMQGRLAIAIDARRVPIERLRSLNLNVTTQQGSPLNSTPVRPSFSGTASGGGGGGGAGAGGGAPGKKEEKAPSWGHVYYLIWPQELQGDAIPTVTVNLVYSPPMPGTPWQNSTIYPEGSVVTPSTDNGRYYTARVGGISGPALEPKFDDLRAKDDIPDNQAVWIDSGTTAPAAAPALPTAPAAPSALGNWKAETVYKAGTYIFYPPIGRYYEASPGGTSDATKAPNFTVNEVRDGSTLVWVDSGNTAPAGTTDSHESLARKDSHPYKAGEVIYDPATTRYYTARTGGVSDGRAPNFTHAPVPDQGTLAWIDAGTLPPETSPAQLPIPTWTANHDYKTGDVVFRPVNGHYYTVTQGGKSRTAEPPFPANKQVLADDSTAKIVSRAQPEVFRDSSNATQTGQWKEVGKGCPGITEDWQPNHPYRNGSCILDPGTNHYFRASIPAAGGMGTSGETRPPFHPVGGVRSSVSDPVIAGTWTDETPIVCKEVAGDWQPHHQYSNTSCILDSVSKDYFQPDDLPAALGPMTSGIARPAFHAPELQHLAVIQWEDSGTNPPSLVTSGQPADQTVTMTYAFPQVHSRYYYNLSSGVVFNTVHTRSFGWKTLALPTGSGSNAQPGLYYPVQTGSSVIVDPVLFFTAYVWPLDAERTWHRGDLRPGITFGLSLAAPGSNFYVGMSSEVRRNIQIVYGFTVAKTSNLAAGSGPSTTNTAAPATVQVFSKGAFLGLSYNISGFLQGLFGGGGKAAASQ